MYGFEKFHPWLKRPLLEKKDTEPPDYTPLAEASDESARIGAELGREQLASAERMYSQQSAMAAGISSQQLAIAQQSADQGRDYYEYLKEFRPAERAMLDEAMVDKSSEIADFDAANQADAAAMSESDSFVYDTNRGAIDEEVGRAVADTQGGYTRSLNQAIRQGLRYGGSVSDVAGKVGTLGATQASATASAANATRGLGIAGARERAGTRLQLRGINKSAKNSQEAISWAKKLDAAGLVKGLPGASTGAYGLAVGAGDSALRNTMAPGVQKQNAMGQAANTTLQGRSLYQSGLGGIMDTQAGLSGDAMSASASGTGAAIGAVGGIAVAVI